MDILTIPPIIAPLVVNKARMLIPLHPGAGTLPACTGQPFYIFFVLPGGFCSFLPPGFTTPPEGGFLLLTGHTAAPLSGFGAATENILLKGLHIIYINL